MEKKEFNLREIYEELGKMNDKIIEDKMRKGIMPVCAIIQEDGVDIIGFSFRDYEEKRMAREKLFKIILNKKTKGYILIQDSKMTTMSKKDGKIQVQDAVMRGLFSPKLKIKECIIYDDKERKITERMKMADTEKKDGFMDTGEAVNMIDEWDLYAEWWDMDNPEHQRIAKAYNKWKEENPEKYEGVAK